MWNRFRYRDSGKGKWAWFLRVAGPETAPDYLVFYCRKLKAWSMKRMGTYGWAGNWKHWSSAKAAKRAAELDFTARDNHRWEELNG
jgi:hypothetical protein